MYFFIYYVFTFDAGFFDPARDAGFLEGGLADTFDAGFDAAFEGGFEAAFEGGLDAALEGGLEATFEAGFAFDTIIRLTEASLILYD